MIYVSKALPDIAPIKIPGKVLTVPNQNMSLKEILTRFTRNEALPIGKDQTFHEGEYDLEKVKASDLVDKAEFIDKMKETQSAYKKQELAKEKAARAAAQKKIEDEERKKREGEKPDPAK